MRLGVLAGAFNPLTRAHLALIDSARGFVDQIVCVVPRAYPHKSFEGAALEDRIAMLEAAKHNYEIAITDRGLFLDIARELRRSNPSAEIHFLCGRDAAERILTWKYALPHTAESMLNEFSLLVASRQGDFNAPPHLAARIRSLPLPPEFDADSSTEVRRRIAAREPWEHLVPDSIVPLVRRIYTTGF
jgi:nicotinate-nucleotide adenylyltransferase